MKLHALADWLDRTLKVGEIEDSSLNGIQFEGKPNVRRVGLAVDACATAFRAALDSRCDLLVVHHGLLWTGEKPTPYRGLRKELLELLFVGGLSLYAAHLPLDLHPRLGNNAELCRLLGVQRRQPWAEYHGSRIGYHGVLARKTELGAVARRLERTLKTRVAILGDAARKVRRIGVVSGGGGDEVAQASQLGLDAYVLGEIQQHQAVLARDLGLAILAAGHYATETVGLKALGRRIRERHQVPCQFLELPTGV